MWNQREENITRNRWREFRPYMFMLFMQIGLAGLTIIGKFALNEGMSTYTFVVYRHLIASILITPFALRYERDALARLTCYTFVKILALGLLEPVMDQNMFFYGMRHTSASLSSTMANLLPTITFIVACVLRLERVRWREKTSKMKLLGSVISVSGAVLMGLYRGPRLIKGMSRGKTNHVIGTTSQNNAAGFLILIGSFFSWSGFMILQKFILEEYPFEITVAALTCVSGTVIGTITEFIFEHKITAWKLHLNLKLLAIVYAGVVVSGISLCIQGNVMRERGPIFVTVFSPVSMILVTIFGIFFLNEDLLLGRTIGAIVICVGLYVVMWGKHGENRVSPHEALTPAPIEFPHQEIKDENKIQITLNGSTDA